ncbi:DsrE family protein [Roseivirga sp.]|uniref:DsrE family protein n=1 Tax=Roseivirga sp. TaxID=1964215 RepID=UPI003B8E54A6
MKFRITLLLLLSIGLNFSYGQEEKKWENPIIKNYGGILDLEGIDVAPDPNLEYKILVELVFKMDNKSKRPAFAAVNIARLMNLHGVGGVKPENLKVVAVIHGRATSSVLNAEAFKEKYDKESPYVPLYKELMDAGVEVVVCGQSYVNSGYNYDQLIDNVKVGTSALTTITTYTQKGYTYFKWD